MRIRFTLLAAACLVLGTVAAAVAAPSDPMDFSAYALQRLKALRPGIDASVTGPLTLTIQGTAMNVTRVYDFCQRRPDACDAELDDFLGKAADFKPPAAIDATMLRAAVRPTAYVDGAQRQFGDVLMRPLAGDLTEVCLIDTPSFARIAQTRDIAKLGLSPDAAFKVCEDNVAAEYPLPADSGAALAPGDVATLDGHEYYESSLMLLHAAWAPVAKRFGGDLLIAVPDARVVIYGNGTSPDVVAKMREAVAAAARDGDRPLSLQVFRWTPQGWEPVSP